jgi:glutamate formiminotransferase
MVAHPTGGEHPGPPRLICVINVSEGRRPAAIQRLTRAAGDALLDAHSDPHHHRSVLTVAGEDAPRAIAEVAVAELDLAEHQGVHPRFGVLDVVPFVPVPGSTATLDDAVAARDRFATWAGDSLALPCFLYGPERSLPDVRRGAFGTLHPDAGPPHPHPTAGAVAVGARMALLAYNLWLADHDIDVARQVAQGLRGEHVRALGLRVGDGAQVSMNLLDPLTVGPATIYDRVAAKVTIARAELVGLAPRAVLDAAPTERWTELDLAADRTIEARLEQLGAG